MSSGEREARAGCDDCALAGGRRAFLRDMAAAAIASVAAMSIAKPAMALAASVSEIEPAAGTLNRSAAGVRERTYAVPRADGVQVDVSNDVILARWENRVYAFSIKCPHKGAQLEWRESEQRVYCPKHKARFTADGAHVSGRGDRDLDRYAVRRSGDSVVVVLDRVYRRDTDLTEWSRAIVAL